MAVLTLFFRTLQLLIPISICCAQHYPCPGLIDAPPYYRRVHFEPKPSGRSGQNYAKMRFGIFYEKSMKEMPPILRALTEDVVDFWSNVLSVRPYDGKMFIKRECVLPVRVVAYSNATKKFEEHCLGPCAKITTCSETVVPEDHLKECNYCFSMNGTDCHVTGQRGSGVENVDMVFYVSAKRSKTCKTTNAIAYASPCNLDENLDRPIVGGINICPTITLSLLGKNKEVVMAIFKHEMMHAFGFSPSLYNYFRDSLGKPLVERNIYGRPIFNWMEGQFGVNVVQTFEREWHVRDGILRSNGAFIVTPNVVREVRAHFNCSKLVGAELEDFGHIGTAIAHWESRVYYHDLMKGAAGFGELRMSRIDLALLEDTGWYKVDYSFAEPMKYGKDLGCDFCMKSCKYWIDKKRGEGSSVEPFCDKTADESANYLCNKREKIFSGCLLNRMEKPVPKKYQFFDKLKGVNEDEIQYYAGSDDMADFCPMPLSNFKFSCIELFTPATIVDPKFNVPLEIRGNDSYCFEARTKWTVKEYKDTCSSGKSFSKGQTAGCFKYSCLSGLLVIEIQSKRFPCFFEGQVLEVKLFGSAGNATHEGTILCPSCKEMCEQGSNFKCRPENPILAFKYSYPNDQCIDDEYLQQMINSLSEEGKSFGGREVKREGKDRNFASPSSRFSAGIILSTVSFVICVFYFEL